MCIKETSTLTERQEKAALKNKKYLKSIKDLAYKNEGELFLISLKNACIEKLRREDNYQLIM